MGQAAQCSQSCGSCEGGCGDTATVKVDVHALAANLAAAEANSAGRACRAESAACAADAAAGGVREPEDRPCKPYVASESQSKDRRWGKCILAAGLEEDGLSAAARGQGFEETPLLPQPIRPPLACETASVSHAAGASHEPGKSEPRQQKALQAPAKVDPARPSNGAEASFEKRFSDDLRPLKAASAMEYLCRAQEERERAQEQRRADQLERLRREKEEVDRERWAEHERIQVHLERQASLRSQASDAKRRAQHVRDRREAVATFLVENGFTGVTAKRKRLVFATYPLHVAAEKGDALLISYLLEEGADAQQRNSTGRTALQVARRKNKDGSHDEALRALGAEP